MIRASRSRCSALRLSGLVRIIQASRRGEMWLRSASARLWLMHLRRRLRQPVKPRALISSKRCLTGTAGSSDRRMPQVLAVGVDEAGTVLGDAEHPLGPVGSRVAFDGVQGQLQAAGKLEQAHTLLEEAVDLVPAFQGRLRAGPLVQGRVQHGGPSRCCVPSPRSGWLRTGCATDAACPRLAPRPAGRGGLQRGVPRGGRYGSKSPRKARIRGRAVGGQLPDQGDLAHALGNRVLRESELLESNLVATPVQ